MSLLEHNRSCGSGKSYKKGQKWRSGGMYGWTSEKWLWHSWWRYHPCVGVSYALPLQSFGKRRLKREMWFSVPTSLYDSFTYFAVCRCQVLYQVQSAGGIWSVLERLQGVDIWGQLVHGSSLLCAPVRYQIAAGWTHVILVWKLCQTGFSNLHMRCEPPSTRWTWCARSESHSGIYG